MSAPPLLAWLGRTVSVTVDRPLGSRHPRHADIVYPVNYGYVPETEAGDGQPIDAYVLGVDEPVARREGVVVAVVVRHDDVEGKLVVAPAGLRLTQEEIAAAVHFQERFFNSEIVMGGKA